MADLFENPLGTDGFEFVEFTSRQPEAVAQLLTQLGFVGEHTQCVLRLPQ